LEEFLGLVIALNNTQAEWTAAGSWETWYCGTSKSRMRMNVKEAPFEILGSSSGGYYNVKVVFKSLPKTALLSFSSTEEPGSALDVVQTMLDALQQ
jgi:hypothetical protein